MNAASDWSATNSSNAVPDYRSCDNLPASGGRTFSTAGDSRESFESFATAQEGSYASMPSSEGNPFTTASNLNDSYNSNYSIYTRRLRQRTFLRRQLYLAEHTPCY